MLIMELSVVFLETLCCTLSILFYGLWLKFNEQKRQLSKHYTTSIRLPLFSANNVFMNAIVIPFVKLLQNPLNIFFYTKLLNKSLMKSCVIVYIPV